MKKRMVHIWYILSLLILLVDAHVEANTREIAINSGVTRVDLNGDGIEDVILKTWYENFNAHGHFTIRFAVRNTESDQAEKKLFEVIAIQDPKDPSRFDEDFHTFQGADCILDDIKLLRGEQESRGVTLLRAIRRIPDSLKFTFSDSEIVDIYVYGFREDKTIEPGNVHFRFEIRDHLETIKSYCDVGTALDDYLTSPQSSTRAH